MSVSDSGASRRIWLLACLGGVLLMILLLSLFAVPAPHKELVQEIAPPEAVALAWSGNELLKEAVSLRDPTPLFLPTR